MNYFNDNDAASIATLRATQPGYVDGRDIRLVQPCDLWGFERCHFFAGAGCWEVACQIAGWEGPIWTASCPCQPFSVAGKGLGTRDKRHLWPDLFRLVQECRPKVLVGEQVGGKAGYGWLDGVFADLEGEGYACRAVDIPACAVDAPHRRNRIYWVALDDSFRRGRIGARESICAGRQPADDADDDFSMADADRIDGWLQHEQSRRDGTRSRQESDRRHDSMANANRGGRGGRPEDPERTAQRRDAAERADGSFWSSAEWIVCADGKTRRVPRPESSVRDVADGLSAGVESRDPGKLLVPRFAGRADAWRLTGNAIVIPLAVEVLRALKETLGD